MSLRVRIALISATAVAIAFAVAALVTFNATRSELIAEVDQSLNERVEKLERAGNIVELVAALSPFDDSSRSPFERGRRGFDAIYWRFFINDGSRIEVGGNLPLGPEEERVIAGEVPFVFRTVGDGDENLRMLTAQISSGTVQVARSLDEVDGSLEGLAQVLRFAAVIGVVLAGVIGYFIARGAARPIGQLAAAAEHVAETQELASRIDVDRDDEIGRLAQSFNAMLAALESSRQQQRRLVHDAGHELRTPLTAIRTNVELLGRAENISPDERSQMIADMESEIQELSGLVTELVDLAAAPPPDDAHVEEVVMGDLVERMADKYRRRTGRAIDVSVDGTVVRGNVAQIERAVANLLDNAAKWGPVDEPIAVTVKEGRVTVADRGPGIAPADRPHVFDRFYRATRDRATPGSGLGLSIVAKVAEDHGGEVFVGDSSGGAEVGFILPTEDGPLR
ncbi:MAG: HAMP domain-containing sensor histidine kinase [Acidimicrobiia bacterium]|nr:HAMP domain-containing sensor histidine kinase [Acidimicrobiia bacterium]